MTRAATMVLALVVLNLLLGALCVVVARGERGSRALRLWGWGTLVYAVGSGSARTRSDRCRAPCSPRTGSTEFAA